MVSCLKNKKAKSRWYPVEIITDADYTDDQVLLANTPVQAESLLYSLEQAAIGISLHMNSDKTGFMCFKEDGPISTLNGKPLKLVDCFTYLGNNISSTQSDVNISIGKAWNIINRLLSIWKSELSNKMNWEFSQAVAMISNKLATLVMGAPKAPFSIATTPRCRGGWYYFPWIAPLYPRSLPYNAECEARWHQVPFFESLVWHDLGLNPILLDHWRTLYSLSQWLVVLSDGCTTWTLTKCLKKI